MKALLTVLPIVLLAGPCLADNGQALEARGITIAPARIEGDRVIVEFAKRPTLSAILPTETLDEAFRGCRDADACKTDETEYETLTTLHLRVSRHQELRGHFYFLSGLGVHELEPDHVLVELVRREAVPNLWEILDKERERRARPKPPGVLCDLARPLPDPDRLPRTDFYAELIAHAPTEIASTDGGYVLRSPTELRIQTYEGRSELTDFVSTSTWSDPTRPPPNENDPRGFVVKANLEFQIEPEPQRYRYYEWWSHDGASRHFAIFDGSEAPFKLAEHQVVDGPPWTSEMDDSARRRRWRELDEE